MSFAAIAVSHWSACTPEAQTRVSKMGAEQNDPPPVWDGVLRAPASLSATGMEGAIKLEWPAVMGAESYLIYWSEYNGVNVSSETIEIQASPYVHVNLNPSKTYYYRVGAVSQGKYGPLSEEASATPQVQGQPTSNLDQPVVFVTSSIVNTISVSWLSVDGAEAYNIYYATTPGVSRTSQVIENATNPFLHSGLVGNSIYYYRVAAVKGGLPGQLSYEVSAVVKSTTDGSTGGNTPLSAPSSISVDVASAQSLQISWSPVEGAEHYNIYFNTSTAVGESSLSILGVSNPHVHTQLQGGLTYYYRVAAVRNGVVGRLSTLASGTLALDDGSGGQGEALAAPVFSGSSPIVGTSSLTLSWSAISGASRYYLYFNDSGPGVNGSSKFIAISSSSTSHTHTNLFGGTTYYYRVAAVKGSGSSMQVGNLSNEISGIPLKPTVMTPIISKTPGIYAFESSLLITMTTSTSGAKIYYRLDGQTPSCDGTASLLYSGPLTLTSSANLKAIACLRPAFNDSQVAGGLFVVNVPSCGDRSDSCYSDATAMTTGFARISGTQTLLEYVAANPDCTGASCFRVWKEHGGFRFLNANGIWMNGWVGWQRTLNRNGNGFTDNFAAYPSVTRGLVGRSCPANSFVLSLAPAVTDQCVYYDGGTPAQTLNLSSGVEGEDFLTSWSSNNSAFGAAPGFYEGNLKVCADRGMRLPALYETTAAKPSGNLPSSADPVFSQNPSTEGVPGEPNGFTWTSTAFLDADGLSTSSFWAWSGGQSRADNSSQANFVRCVLPSDPLRFCGQKSNSCYSNTWLMSSGRAHVTTGEEIEYARVNISQGFSVWKKKDDSRVLKPDGFWNGPNDWQKRLSRKGSDFVEEDFTDSANLAGRRCPANVFINYQMMTATGTCLYYDQGGEAQWLNQDKVSGAIVGEDYLERWDDPASGRAAQRSWYEGNIKFCADRGMRLPTLYETTAAIGSTLPTAILTEGDVKPRFAGSSGGVPPLSNQRVWTATGLNNGATKFYFFDSVTYGESLSSPPQQTSQATVFARCVLPASEPRFSIETQPASIVYFGEPITFSVIVNADPTVQLAYQWQKSTDNGLSFVNLSNATSQTLQLSELTSTDHRTQYRVVISGSSLLGQMPPVTQTTSAATIFIASRLPTCGNSASNSCYSNTAALAEEAALLKDGTTLVELVKGAGDFKVWREYFGEQRAMQASGLWDDESSWQLSLTRSGESFSTTFFTDFAILAGRVCPTNVFLSRAKPAELNRCIYYDAGTAIRSLANNLVGVEREDFLASWSSVFSGMGQSLSWYEGNITPCADKGMRLPTLYETTATAVPAFAPPGSGLRFDGKGVPTMGGYTWTASGQQERSTFFIGWNGALSTVIGSSVNASVRCVLP